MLSKPRAHLSRKTIYWAAAAAILLAVLSVGLMLAGRWLSPAARREVVRLLKQQYESDIQIATLDVSLFPWPHASGTGLVFRKDGRTDLPPLIELARFHAQTGWLDLVHSPLRISSVKLEGLRIHIAHGEKKSDAGEKSPPPSFEIETVTADGTVLELLPKTPGKEPLRFDIYHLHLKSVNPNGTMHYQAVLRNAKPPGMINAAGEFGPWNTADPGETPVTGDYTFANANLGVFRGMAGTLSSTGKFRGPLDRIEVTGQTDTPDFTIRAGNHPVHLTTTFSATVDGTDGDTYLHPVTAHFGDTTVVARAQSAGALVPRARQSLSIPKWKTVILPTCCVWV